MPGLWAVIGQILRLATPYFRSHEKGFACGVLGCILGIELAQVYAQVKLNTWNLRFFNALQEKDVGTWQYELGVFVILGCTLVVLGVLQLYMNQWLQIRWRRWMTEHYLSDWLRANNHYRMQLRGLTDNPDQRISIDIQLFIANALTLGIGMLGAITSLASFVVILWGMSARTPLPIVGHDVSFPGYLVLAALASAAAGTVLAHLVGRKLIGLNFDQQRYEADFRFGLVRVRENSEQIALLRGEDTEQRTLMGAFGSVVINWRAIMARQLKLGFFTGAYGQFSFLLPSLLIAPSFFSGASMLGTLMQTSSAFGQVSLGFNFFVNNYRVLADWKAVINRLVGFDQAARAVEAEAQSRGVTRIETAAGQPTVSVDELDLRLPDGRPLIQAQRMAFGKGERILITGPSGSGKSTMFRALGGIWPYGEGRISVPAGCTVMIVPQRPYLPIGPFGAAVCFPAPAGAWSRAEIEGALRKVGLEAFIPAIDSPGHWGHRLSLGEQQRVAIARALLHRPDILFLDEATASLDEAAEAKLYALLHEMLPESAIVSIAHRSALRALHGRCFLLVTEGGVSRLVEDLSERQHDPSGVRG
ncbi:MAG: ABC transporter ATP-binding protein/permease [Gammaproteobacteria bacterium]|nr:ABC transporter ATP-binding protein/permease [Gammaproteobacteria bacterium]